MAPGWRVQGTSTTVLLSPKRQRADVNAVDTFEHSTVSPDCPWVEDTAMRRKVAIRAAPAAIRWQFWP